MMSCRRAIVACNVYISAGKPKHKELLLDLLEKTQEHCLRLNTKNNSPKERVVVVHAFADGPYDRTSFHLAGTPDLVAIVGSSLAVSAVEALICFENSSEEDDSRRIRNEKEQPIHPTVGLVDHVSVLPLDEDINSNIDHSAGSDDNDDDNENITGSVARKIGEALSSKKNVDVLYYGRAHPAGTPLATVRRESTRFFHSPDEKKNNSDTENGNVEDNNEISVGQTTVGATDRFVENYNIRLRPSVSRTVARSLTENIRGRSGIGLPLVEALTLAYGSDQYEVACNLLDPCATSAEDIEQRMRIWEKQQKLVQPQKQKCTLGLVEKSYRVGTTSELCLNALREVETMERENVYNKAIKKGLETYLCVSTEQL
jgi:glutamate formiminotransferase